MSNRRWSVSAANAEPAETDNHPSHSPARAEQCFCSALAGLDECWVFASRRFRSRCSLHRRLLTLRPFGAAFLLVQIPMPWRGGSFRSFAASRLRVRQNGGRGAHAPFFSASPR